MTWNITALKALKLKPKLTQVFIMDETFNLKAYHVSIRREEFTDEE